MKNIFNKFAFFIALSFVFISCGNLTTSENDDSIPQGKGKITISTDLQNGRSVLPTAIEQDTRGLTWILSGVKAGEPKQIGYWEDDTDKTAYQKMVADTSLLVDTGTWDFTLTASNTDGENVLSATIPATINAGENKLNFVMQEATENAASGSIEFTLNFPKDVVGNVVATLYKYDNDNTVVDTNRQLTIDNSSNNNFDSVKYSYPDTTGTTGTTSSPLSAGYYILKIQLQQEGYATTPEVEYINTYSCLIRVAPGLTSYGVYTLDKLAQLYTIKYECGRGNIENQLITTSYNKYTSFELPEPTYQGHYFAGWYTRNYKDDGTFTEELFGNAGETTTISEDITLYAKWNKEVTGITHANNTLYISSYEGLKVFRDIVNGSLESNITIPANAANSGASVTCNAGPPVTTYNAELQSNITIDEDWTPIGVYTDALSQVPYVGEFKGNNNTITFGANVSINSQAAGLFGAISDGCNIYNLIIDGNIQSSSDSSSYAGGIVGVANGGSVQNCVNKAKIQNASSAGGIAGKAQNTSFNGCVNLGEITGTSYSAGIVGAAAASTSINLCINVGKLTSSITARGISGGAPTDIIVQNCINLGTLSAGNFIYGISSGSGTISSNISAGKFEGTVMYDFYAVCSSASNTNYYDNSICSESNFDIGSAEGKTTSEFSNWSPPDEFAWLAAEGRYPLPNLLVNSFSESIWNELCVAAEISVSDPMGGITVTDFTGLSNAYTAAPDDGTETVIVLQNDISINSYINITSGKNIKIISNKDVTIYRDSSFTGSFFTVNSGATLTLGGSDYTITLDGRDSSLNEVSASYPFIVVKGDFTFEKKCIMQYNTNNTTSTNNIGGGIVVNSGKLTINEGIIQYCQATKGGGINVTAAAEIIVNGGKIVNNAASGNGGGIAIKAATLILDCGSEISGNKSTLSSAISSAGGGGIYANGNANITLNECIIKDNITNSAGGGVFASLATTAISENAIIQNNGCNVNLSDSCNFYGTWNDSGLTTNYNIVNGQETETLSYLYNAICINIGTLGYDKTALIPVINNEYTINGTDSTGVFKSGRNVTLSPYLIGQYEVTQELYNSVMSNNPSSFTESAATGETQNLRPVETVSWYQAIVFCNALTKQVLGENNCVYYSDAEFTEVYNETNAETLSTVYFNIAKSGYRLPTVAEWTFAAKGGDPNVSDWNYIYSGSDTIDEVAWCATNAETKTHEVGLKTSNKINIYDMTGNVSEWCWDLYRSDDEIPTDTITNPTGPESGSMGWNALGGNYGHNSTSTTNYLLISKRYYTTVAIETIGFRLCRSIIQ